MTHLQAKEKDLFAWFGAKCSSSTSCLLPLGDPAKRSVRESNLLVGSPGFIIAVAWEPLHVLVCCIARSVWLIVLTVCRGGAFVLEPPGIIPIQTLYKPEVSMI